VPMQENVVFLQTKIGCLCRKIGCLCRKFGCLCNDCQSVGVEVGYPHLKINAGLLLVGLLVAR
jgi:hypothetical protein